MFIKIIFCNPTGAISGYIRIRHKRRKPTFDIIAIDQRHPRVITQCDHFLSDFFYGMFNAHATCSDRSDDGDIRQNDGFKPIMKANALWAKFLDDHLRFWMLSASSFFDSAVHIAACEESPFFFRTLRIAYTHNLQQGLHVRFWLQLRHSDSIALRQNRTDGDLGACLASAARHRYQFNIRVRSEKLTH